MANTKIKDLTEKATGAATDEFAINDVAGGNTDKKMGMDGLRVTESQITDLQSYLVNVVEDTTPQLGGNLDCQGNDITAVEKVVITSTLPQFILEESDQVTNNKKWACEVTGSSFTIAAINDAESSNISAFKIARDSGTNTIKNIKLKTGATGTSRLTITDTAITLGASVNIDFAGNNIINTGTLTLPTDTDTLVGRATTDTFTNKTFDLTDNTLNGTLAEFNTAVSDATLAILGANTFTGTQTFGGNTLTGVGIVNLTKVNKEISSGDIAATSAYSDIDVEGQSDSTDDLDHVTGLIAGDVFLCAAENNARTIVLKNLVSGAGRLRLGADFSLDHSTDMAWFISQSTDGDWLNISTKSNG